MRKICILVMAIIFLDACKEQKKEGVYLNYIKDNNTLLLNFENKTNRDAVFLIPNLLEFGDKNYRELSTRGSLEGDYPINVFALLKPVHISQLYQKKLDSLHNSYLTEIGNADLVGNVRLEDGNSVAYLKSHESVKFKYDLVIRSMMTKFKKTYSSEFKQHYYPYDKILKGNYPYGEYMKRFSKLNFGKAQFIYQPIIQDSLILKLSEKDVTN